MFDLIKSNIIGPASTRIGSLTAGGLLMLGMTEPHANAVGLGVAALLGFGCDLMLAWFRKRSIQTRARAEGARDVVSQLGVPLVGPADG